MLESHLMRMDDSMGSNEILPNVGAINAETMRPRLLRNKVWPGTLHQIPSFYRQKLRSWAERCLPEVTQSWAWNWPGLGIGLVASLSPRVLLLYETMRTGEEDKQDQDQEVWDA